MKLNEKLKLLRTTSNLTMDALAGEFSRLYGSKTEAPTISRWEVGERVPSTQSLLYYCDYFNCSFDDLVGFVDKNIVTLEQMSEREVEELKLFTDIAIQQFKFFRGKKFDKKSRMLLKSECRKLYGKLLYMDY